MIPELSDMRKRVLDLVKQSPTLSQREAAVVILFRRGSFDVAYAYMPFGSYDHADHTYEVDEDVVEEVNLEEAET